MTDIILTSLIVALMATVFFAYRIIETRFGYQQAERLRIVQSLLFLLIVFTHGALIFGYREIFLLMGISFIVSYGAEIIGTNTGLIFGKYHYTDKSCPLPSFRGVPLCYPIAWCGLIYAGLWQAIIILSNDTPGIIKLSWPLLITTAALVTLVDIILDPVAVDEQRWVWNRQGRYYGVPITNFIGWFITALAIITIFYLINGPQILLSSHAPWFTYSPALGYALLAAASSRPALERKLTIPFLVAVTSAVIFITLFIKKIAT